MAAKDYMVDVADIPKYGPPNMAAELYNMIRGVPKAYQEGKANEFANQKAEFEQDVERPYQKRALERADVAGQMTQDVMKQRFRELQNDPSGGGDGFDSSDNARTPAQRLTDGTGGGKVEGQYTVADLMKGAKGIADQPNAVRDLERILQIEPGARLNAQQEQAVREYVARDAQGDDNLTGSTGPSGLPPDPRTQAPPNLQPGMMGAPPNLAPGSPQGPVPMMSGAAYGGPPGVPAGPPGAPQGPPGAAPGPQVAQAGPPSLSSRLEPYVRPQQPAPGAPNQPELWSEDKIRAVRAHAKHIDDMANFGGPMAAGDKERAKRMYEAAQKQEEARSEIAKKRAEATDPAVQQENTRKEIEKGNIAAGQKEQGRLQSAAQTAIRSNQQLAVMRTQMSDPNFYSGPAHALNQKYKEWLAVLPGGNPDAASPMQEFHKTTLELLNQRIQSAVQSGYSRIQIREIDNMKAQIANLDINAGSNRYIMEEMQRIHQMDIKLARFSDQYADSHGGYLDRGWPAARDAFMERPENRLFTDQEIAHPASIAPAYFPKSMYGDVAKTKAFVRSQGLKDSDPVAVDDTTKPPGPDGLPRRKLIDAGHLLRITVDTPAGR